MKFALKVLGAICCVVPPAVTMLLASPPALSALPWQVDPPTQSWQVTLVFLPYYLSIPLIPGYLWAVYIAMSGRVPRELYRRLVRITLVLTAMIALYATLFSYAVFPIFVPSAFVTLVGSVLLFRAVGGRVRAVSGTATSPLP